MTEFRDTEGQCWEVWSLNPLAARALWAAPWMELGFLGTQEYSGSSIATHPIPTLLGSGWVVDH